MNSGIAGFKLQPLYEVKEELERAFHHGQGYTLIARSLSQLEHYALHHLPGSHRQPGLTSPSVEKLYRRFIRQIEEWLDEYRDGAHILTVELLLFIQQWLRDHQQLAVATMPGATLSAAEASTPAG